MGLTQASSIGYACICIDADQILGLAQACSIRYACLCIDADQILSSRNCKKNTSKPCPDRIRNTQLLILQYDDHNKGTTPATTI